MRAGFSLITAILFIVLVATLGAMALNLSTQSTKQSTDVYLQAQAELLAKSGAELALLAISTHDINTTNGCLNQVNASYPSATNPIFDINITLQYIGNGLNVASGTQCNLIHDDIATADSNVTVLMDVFVTSRPDISTEPIRFHRRTLQKP